MPVKTFSYDPYSSCEINYQNLEKHHIEETTVLYKKLKKLRKEVKDLKKQLESKAK